MATASQIISRALRLIGVQDPRQALDAEEAQNALTTLNDMGQRWLANGLVAAWTNVTSLTGSVTPAAKANDALAYSLALRLAPEYNVEPPALVVQQAAIELRDLWRDRLTSTGANTAENIILRAIRLLSGSQPQVLPDTVSFPGALDVLNSMLAEWHEADIGLPDYSFSSLAASVSSDIADREAIAYQLAMRLAPEYGISVAGEFAAAADASMTRLRLRYFQPGVSGFSELPGESLAYSIETDR